MNSKITIIIPSYNCAETIRRAIDSVLEQDYPNKEVIVIDDGSTDATVDVLQQYGGELTVMQQANSGPSAARNRGLKSANGRFIAFLDSDDYWLPGFLSQCASVLTNARDRVAVSTMTKAIHWSGRKGIIPSMFRESTLSIEISDFFEFWAAHDHIRTGSVMFDREVSGEVPLFREDLMVSEDLEYWANLATLGKWLFLPQVLFVTDGRHHSKEMTWKQKNKRRRESVPTVEEWEQRLVSKVGDQELRGFEQMRGRVARSFAHMNILSHHDYAARTVVLTHGKDFPAGKLDKMLLVAARCGKACWGILARALRIREALKEFYISLRAKQATKGKAVTL